MECTNCGHQQSSGKFCGKCGNAIAAAETVNVNQPNNRETVHGSEMAAAAPVYQGQPESNLDVEKVKETSKQYWMYFLEHLKHPSSIIKDPDKNFLNALITFAIFALLTTLAVNDLISYIMEPVNSFASMFEQESLKPSFFQILLYVIITLAVVFGLSIGSLYLISKFFGPQTSFKAIATVFGTYLVPMSVVLLAAFLLLLIDSQGIGSSLFSIGILFSAFIMPLFIISILLNQKSQNVDAFYAFIGYSVLFMVGLSIVLSVVIDSSLSELMYELEYLF